jgi:Na+/alanine symporter
MNSILKNTQKYAIPVMLVIGLTLLAIYSDPEDVNDSFGPIVGIMASVTFVSVPGALSAIWDFLTQLPLVIVVLVGGAVYFTLRFNFINILGFYHAIEVLTGKYDNPDDPGEVSHFQALSSALSATVGLGNIAGVAIAVSVGGPGAVFWMMATALFGMTAKFAECTLGQLYRRVDARGDVQGGPMVYLRDGLADIGMPNLGKYLSVVFAVLCIGGSFGGGNMFQANQSFEATAQVIPWFGGDKATGEVTLTSEIPVAYDLKTYFVQFHKPSQKGVDGEGRKLVYTPAEDFVLDASDWTQRPDGAYTTTVAVVGKTSDSKFNIDANKITELHVGEVEGRSVKFAPVTSIKVSNAEPISGGTGNRGWLFGAVLAFLVGVVIVGGIKSIGKVAEKIVPTMCGIYLLAALGVIIMNISMLDDAIGIIVREAFTPAAGMGGLIGVFIQGVKRAAFSSEAGVGSAAIAHSAAKTDEPVREGIVALLEPFIDTIVVCFMTGMVIVISGVYADPATAGLDGVQLTSAAFGATFSWFPYVLSGAVFLFAYSTMISWSYYGERCWTFLFGPDQSMTYRFIFLVFVWLGCVASVQNVVDFSDIMILSMAFPNVLGVVLLSGKIRLALEDYWTRYKTGQFTEYR